ncbi:MAG: DUF3579 domain-containing protein [Gammaproteobacteria bacterium]|nr:DUF3579 domain-containing protein [Gammaproteobacteria bacterium]
MDAPQKHTRVIVRGVTDQGKDFRPADWAERMAGALSTFRGRRIIYSPLLQPIVLNGKKCLIVDEELKQVSLPLYEEIMEFAESNHLVVDKE